MAAARGTRTSMVTTAAHQGTLQNSTLGAGELCRGLREAGEGRLDAAVDGHRDQGPETRLQRPMTRDQEPSEGAKSEPLSGFSTMSTSVYAVTEPVMEREARVWPWTCTTVHRNPLACTRSESSLKKTGRHAQEDGKTATQEDGRRERRNTGRQHAYGAKHPAPRSRRVRSTRQEVHEEREVHEGHGGGSREARKLHRLLACVCLKLRHRGCSSTSLRSGKRAGLELEA